MIKQLIRAGAVTAVAVSAAALPNAAQALTFAPINLSGIAPIGVLPNGSQLLGPTPYFDGTFGQLGTFTVTLVSRGTGATNRPVGNASGDLTMATQPAGSVQIRIDFTPVVADPLNPWKAQLPSIKLSQTSAPAGTPIPSAFNPYEANTENYSVVSSGGTATGWLNSPGTLGAGILPDNSSFFVNNAVGTNAAWTFNNNDTQPAGSNTIPFQYTSTGGLNSTVGSLLITYSSTSNAFNAATFNIMTMGVPEPLTILGAGTAAGFGAFFKRELAKKRKKTEEENA